MFIQLFAQVGAKYAFGALATLSAMTVDTPPLEAPAITRSDETADHVIKAVPLADRTITSSLSVIGPAGDNTASIGNVVSVDTDSKLNPAPLVNAANSADVTFTVTGLEADDTGSITRTDPTGRQDVVNIGSNGTYSVTVSNPSDAINFSLSATERAGNQTILDPPTILWGDGSGNASVGTPQLPNLLTGYAARPPWGVAGVDYAVGINLGTVLKDPTLITNMPEVSVDIANHLIRVAGSNVKLNGYDFSLHGGWGIYIQGPRSGGAASNVTIENCNFQVGANNVVPIHADSDAGYITLEHNIIDGGGLGVNGNNNSAIYSLFTPGSGGATVEYNWFKNAPVDGIDTQGTGGDFTIAYNLFDTAMFDPSAHSDWIQTVGAVSNLLVEYNTYFQPAANGSGWPGTLNSMIARLGDENGTTINNPIIAYNTAVALGATGRDINGANTYGAVLNMVQLTAHDGVAGSEILNPSLYNNYMDTTGVYYGIYYPLSGGPSVNNIVNPNVYGNVNMVNGAPLLARTSNSPEGGVPAGAPAAPVITGDAIVNGNEVSLTGMAPANTTIDVFNGAALLGTTRANGSGSWSYTTSPLSNGSQSFTVTATDAAGNTSPASPSVAVVIGALTPGPTLTAIVWSFES